MGNTLSKFAKDGTVVKVTVSNEKTKEKRHTQFESKIQEEGKAEKQSKYEQTGQQENCKTRNACDDVCKNTFNFRTNRNHTRSHATALESYTKLRYYCQVTEKELNVRTCDEKLFIASCKASAVHDISLATYFKAKSFFYPRTRPVFQVYAIGFRAEHILLSSLGSVYFIKNILLHQELRRLFLVEEHFRLASFCLSPYNFEKGVTLQLAARGYFCDVDGRVKCAYCDKDERSEVTNITQLHRPNCIVQGSRGCFGRAIADHYGASSTDWLVRSAPNIPEQDGIGHFIDISVTRSIPRLGGTQQVTQDFLVPQDQEQSLREGATSRAQTCASLYSPSTCGILVTEVQCRRTNQDRLSQRAVQDRINFYIRTISTRQEFQCENQVVSLHPAENREQDEIYNRRDVREKMFSDAGLKAKKTYVHRTRINEDMSPENTTLIENARLRSWTQCCNCKMRRRNIVFMPCGHLVVCDQCIVNATICPTCMRQVDIALKIDV